METMKSKRIGFTTRFTDEEENCVHLYPILEYEDRDTGFTFCDVGDKPFGALECGTNTREEISNFLRGSGIANGLAIIDAHVKMHKENIKMCEQRIEELRKTIEFLENLYVKEEDVLEQTLRYKQ